MKQSSLVDSTAITLAAISSGGTARNFWELHALLLHRGIALPAPLIEFERKYTHVDRGAVVRSLAYFGDADAEPLPRGLDVNHWAAIKATFQRWVAEL